MLGQLLAQGSNGAPSASLWPSACCGRPGLSAAGLGRTPTELSTLDLSSLLSPTAGGTADGDPLGSLYSALGMDPAALPAGSTASLQYAQVQFEINYQSQRLIRAENGLQMEQVNFTLRGDYQFLQIQAGQTASGADEAAAADPTAQLLDYFSPEKTAQRILDFALNFFPLSSEYEAEGDAQGARQSFADRMGQAIQKGFDEALNILGRLPEDIQQNVDETHERVFSGLDNFVQNGLEPTRMNPAAAYERLQAYQMEMYFSYTGIQVSSARTYDAQGTAETPRPDAPALLDLSA